MHRVTYYEDADRHAGRRGTIGSCLEDDSRLEERTIHAYDPDLEEQCLQEVLVQRAPVSAEPLEQLDG